MSRDIVLVISGLFSICIYKAARFLRMQGERQSSREKSVLFCGDYL